VTQFDQAQTAVGAWHRRTFGAHVPPAWLGLALAEEAGEVCRALLDNAGAPRRSGRHPGTVAAEAADVLIVLLALADRCGIDLEAAFDAKFAVVTKRRYPDPTRTDCTARTPRTPQAQGGTP
jgi:NTP pyrophosphatase (non-canonical NTP hydrolase)